MKIKRGTVAVLALAGLTLAACGGNASDKASCQIVQGSYSDMVSLMDRWQYGNAPTGDMLDALQDLSDDANGQAAIANSSDFKSAAGDVGRSARSVYESVNSGVGLETAASALASASRTMNSVCASMK